MPGSDSSSRETPHRLDERGECDDCGLESWLAVTESGTYCWNCIPDEDLAILLRDIHSGG